jgi:hypothetical protein
MNPHYLLSQYILQAAKTCEVFMRQGCINEIILRIALEHGITTSSICKIHKNVSWNGEHVIGLYTQMTAC